MADRRGLYVPSPKNGAAPKITTPAAGNIIKFAAVKG
jgi:hypothetical protein